MEEINQMRQWKKSLLIFALGITLLLGGCSGGSSKAISIYNDAQKALMKLDSCASHTVF